MRHQHSHAIERLSKLLEGEQQISDAPIIEFDNGQACIPQHFLKFSHTRDSVEKIVLNIEYSDLYPIFVCEENRQIYIQIGIIGQDNYASDDRKKTKIVYGRKWRVEPRLPSSEVIQTVYLALIVAREHEVRELLRIEHLGALTTPFNNHHDLPALAHLRDQFTLQSHHHINESEIKELLSTLSYDKGAIKLRSIQRLPNQQWLFEVQVIAKQPSNLYELPAKKGIELTFVLKECSINTLLHEIMAQLLMVSKHHVAENFCYRGFKRFSHAYSVLTISKLSAKMRINNQHNANDSFIKAVDNSNYSTDKSRIPQQQSGPLAKKIAQNLALHSVIEGLLPELTYHK